MSSLRFQWPKPVMWPSLVSMGQKMSSTSAGQSCLKVTRESRVWVILLFKGSEIRNNKSTYHREARRMRRGYQLMPEAAGHHSPAHLCQPRCHVTHVLKRRPTSADRLLELEQSQLNPNTFSELHMPSPGSSSVCTETISLLRDQNPS